MEEEEEEEEPLLAFEEVSIHVRPDNFPVAHP